VKRDHEELAKAVAIFVVIPILFYFFLVAAARRLTAPLLAVALASGCSHAADPILLRQHKDGIALIGSAAEVPGPRSPAQIDRIRADVRAEQLNADRLAGQ